VGLIVADVKKKQKKTLLTESLRKQVPKLLKTALPNQPTAIWFKYMRAVNQAGELSEMHPSGKWPNLHVIQGER